MVGELILIGAGSDWFWTAVQAVVVVLSAFFLYRQIGYQANTHIVSTIESIWMRYDSHDLLLARARCAAFYLKNGGNLSGDVHNVLSFWEQIGTYVRLKALPLDAFSLSFMYYIDYYYYAFEESINLHRRQFAEPYLYLDMERACRSMHEYMRRIGQPLARPTPEQLSEFFRDEVDASMRLLPEHEASDFASIIDSLGRSNTEKANDRVSEE